MLRRGLSCTNGAAAVFWPSFFLFCSFAPLALSATVGARHQIKSINSTQLVRWRPASVRVALLCCSVDGAVSGLTTVLVVKVACVFCLWRCLRLNLFLLWRWHVGPRYLQTVVQQAEVALRWALVRAWVLIFVVFASSVGRLRVQCSVHLDDIAPPLCARARGAGLAASRPGDSSALISSSRACTDSGLGAGVGAKAIMPVMRAVYPETRKPKLSSSSCPSGCRQIHS